MKQPLFIAMDFGTQSVRAVLIDAGGKLLRQFTVKTQPYFASRPGYAEQEPAYYWSKLGEACRGLMVQINREELPRIQAATLTTQRSTVIVTDERGEALRPAITWLDRRRAAAGNWPSGMLKMGLKAINMYDALLYSIRESEANWIRQNEPGIWSKAHKVLFLSGYLTKKLAGRFVDSTGNSVGYLPFDFKKQAWDVPSGMKFKMFPVEREKLVDLVQPGEQLGYITPDAAAHTQLPEGLPLIAAASDKACEVLGSGVYEPDVGCLSYGTTATFQTSGPKYREVTPFFPPYPAAIPHYYNTEVMIYRGFWMISWFKREFGYKEVKDAEKQGLEPEVLFNKFLEEVPPGSMGLTLQPYWSPGLKNPGLEAKGAVIGFGDVHTRAHLYRAIIEGLAYALRDGLETTQKRTKTPVKKLRVSGGGSQSELIMQLTADVFGLPAERPHVHETSALGAAMNAAVGTGLYSGYEQAIANMYRTRDAFYPKPYNQRIYEKLYTRVYRKMYGQLKGLYREIQAITGYPEL